MRPSDVEGCILQLKVLSDGSTAVYKLHYTAWLAVLQLTVVMFSSPRGKAHQSGCFGFCGTSDCTFRRGLDKALKPHPDDSSVDRQRSGVFIAGIGNAEWQRPSESGTSTESIYTAASICTDLRQGPDAFGSNNGPAVRGAVNVRGQRRSGQA